jgi:nucleoside-diphosphate kinase
MAVETTLSILKPDALEKNLIGEIISRFEEEGLTPVGLRMVHLSQREAEQFYAVHAERPFFGELTEFMTRNPVVVMALRGEDAIARNREIMGATNPDEADDGTIRADFASSIGENTVHGSDSAENAKIEVNFFFRGTELFNR